MNKCRICFGELGINYRDLLERRNITVLLCDKCYKKEIMKSPLEILNNIVKKFKEEEGIEESIYTESKEVN